MAYIYNLYKYIYESTVEIHSNRKLLTIACRKLSKRDNLQSAKQSEAQNSQNRSLPMGSRYSWWELRSTKNKMFERKVINDTTD